MAVAAALIMLAGLAVWMLARYVATKRMERRLMVLENAGRMQ